MRVRQAGEFVLVAAFVIGLAYVVMDVLFTINTQGV